MNPYTRCPPEIADILLDIIQQGLLGIRACSDIRRSQIEANHLHNLPSLVKAFSWGRLRYYLEIEKPEYVRDTSTWPCHGCEEAWKKLEALLPPGAKLKDSWTDQSSNNEK